jgi:hypothetical protein
MHSATIDTDRASPAPLAGGRVAFVLAALSLGAYVLVGVVFAMNSHGRLGPNGAPLFYDFSAFYQAAGFADSGHAARAYDDSAMLASEQALFPGASLRLPWNYPPTFQLLLAPLGALPYVAAWLVWSGALYGLYVLLAGRIAAAGQRWMVLLAPGAAVNLLVGQNGLLSTVLMGGGVMLLRSRPLLGGALLGLMSYKPHFAVLVPLVLICGREWRALGAAIASGAGLALLALAVFGVDPWFAFVHKALEPSSIFSSSSSDWRSIPSVMIMARSLDAGTALSSALHWSVAAAAAPSAYLVWRKTGDGRLRAAALATATLLVTPYLRVYDLALLILPIAALLPRPDEKAPIADLVVVCVAWLLPVVLLFSHSGVQFGPVITVALMGLIVWRVARARHPAMPAVRGATMAWGAP